MSLSTNGAMALASSAHDGSTFHVQKLSLQRVDVAYGHPKQVRVLVPVPVPVLQLQLQARC